MTPAPAWITDKACRPEHAGLFFGDEEGRAKALALCAGCPTRAQCRAEAEAQGDIVDGYTMYGQVVGGCGPKAAPSRAKPAVMLPCMLEGCRVVFAKRQGSNMYCSPACADQGRRISRRESSRRRRGAA